MSVRLVCFAALLCLAISEARKCNPAWRKPRKDSKLHAYYELNHGKLADEADPTTLKLVHVVFRHGNRTPDPDSVYPKDPYLNETYYPIGYGELTNKGKLAEYNLGKELRNRYGKFLGDIYTPEVIDASSTDFSRTKMSLELVLAGLWPPAKMQQWSTDLMWQPIPYNYKRQDEDTLLGDPNTSFSKFHELYEENLKSEANQNENKKLHEFYGYLSKNTGLNVTNPADIYNIFFTLFAEEDLGFTLPQWTRCVWPGMITEIATRFYRLLTETNELRRYSTGVFLKKIVQNSMKMMNGDLKPEGRKMFVYSAHERNVALTLISLRVFYPHIPPYSSYVVLEFHKIDGEFGFKVLYQDNEEKLPKLLTIPNCSEFCSFDKFNKLFKDELNVSSK